MRIVTFWKNAVEQLSPEVLIRKRRAWPRANEAVLYWGKAAARTVAAFPPQGGLPALVISPEAAPRIISFGVRWVRGEHPLPGNGSFEAGAALLDFFDTLRRFGVPKLRVYLSGGASSLAWIPSGLPRSALLKALAELSTRGLDIRELNRERSRLCALKAGGAARWLHLLAPGVRARVELISDVAPYGPEVVGSGPFWDGRIPHRILADNCDLVERFVQAAGRAEVEEVACGKTQSIRNTVLELDGKLRGSERGELVVLGCEPTLRLKSGSGRGGRMTQLAAELLDRFWERPYSIEILCASSDGSDGNSGAAAVWIAAESFEKIRARGPNERARLRQAIRRFDSAGYFLSTRFAKLIPAFPSGTNVQDLVALRVMAGPLL